MTLRPARSPAFPLALLLLAFSTAGFGSCGGKKECSSDPDCGYGQRCTAGSCHRLTWFCATDSVSMNDRGEWRDCERYRCDALTGKCLTEGNGTDDCRGGALWDATSFTCVCPAGGGCGGSAAPPPYDLTGYRTCTRDADCGASEMCWRDPQQQVPVPRCVSRNNYCGFDAYGAASISPGTPLDAGGNLSRTFTSCGSYGCEPVSGECLTFCLSSNDCQAGSSCLLCFADGVVFCPPTPQVCWP